MHIRSFLPAMLSTRSCWNEKALWVPHAFAMRHEYSDTPNIGQVALDPCTGLIAKAHG